MHTSLHCPQSTLVVIIVFLFYVTIQSTWPQSQLCAFITNADKMGIDIQFMVEHCGGSIKSSEKDGDSDVEPDFDYADLLESSEGSFD